MNAVVLANPFGVSRTADPGALGNTDAQRAIAEVQAAMVVARANPRNPKEAMDRILNVCTRPALAASALYAFSRGGTDISGPSIRLAEAVAQQWGNMQFGFREISRGLDADGVGYSEVESFAWDMETNTKRPAQFRVRHWRDTKAGGYKLKDERDIYELVANQAQRRVRACILAVIPGDVIETAANQCDITLKTTADTSPEAMKKMLAALAEFNVSKEQVEKRIQRHIEAIQPAQVVMLRKIYASLRDGMSSAADWFDVTGETTTTVEDIKSKARTRPAMQTPESVLASEAKKQQIDPDTGEVTAENGPRNPPQWEPSDEEKASIKAREVAEAGEQTTSRPRRERPVSARME